MTKHIPDGNTLRPLKDAAEILRHGFDVWPENADERRIDDFLRRTRARPVTRRPVPAYVWALFLLAAFCAGAGLAVIIGDMLATAAATVVQAEGWRG